MLEQAARTTWISVWVVLTCTLALSSVNAEDNLWQPGVRGGIPDVEAVFNVEGFGAEGNGITDDAAAFQAALDAALAEGGGAVVVPPGTFLLRSPIFLGDGVVLRGSGATTTFLDFDLAGSGDHAIQIITYERGDWVDVVSGLNSGSSTIVVADGSGFTAPTFAEIEQDNDPDVMYTNPGWNQFWAQRAVGQVIRVVARSGNLLTLESPLRLDYSIQLNPRIRPHGSVEYAGLEGFHIERLDDGEGGLILIKNSAWVWVRGIESAMATRFHIDAEIVYGCEIRDSYFHHAHDYGNGGFGYGVTLERHTTGCLVENNVFSNLRHSILVQLGATENVIAYNYSREPSEVPGYVQTDLSFHGHFPHHNLVEGNIFQKVGLSDWWGPAGPGNTLLRNCVERKGIQLLDSSHGQRLIGNVLPVGDPKNVIDIHVSVQDSYLNGNHVSGEVQWDPDTPDQIIAGSFYRTTKPAFFEHLPWPGIGGDLGAGCSNPAKDRWARGRPAIDPNEIFGNGFESGDTGAWTETGD